MKFFTSILTLVLSLAGFGLFAQPLNLPVTFNDDSINYGLTDFGGNASEIVVDPTDAGNKVARSTKTAGAELWAGTTIGGSVGFSSPVPFAAGNTTMTVRVWSPDAGIPVLLKAEAASDPTISVETLANTTVAMAWETLTFDFSNQAPGTAAINFGNSYNKVSIFFNFGTTGAQAGEKTYFWDDVQFGGEPVETSTIKFQVDMSDYTGSFTTAFISGGFNDWSGGANPLTDMGDGIWETTLTFTNGTILEYKFQLDEWSVDEQFQDGDPCTLTDPSGQFVNRVLEVTQDGTVCYEWQTCISCVPVSVFERPVVDLTLFDLVPNSVIDNTLIKFNTEVSDKKEVRIFNTSGMLISQFRVDAFTTQFLLPTADLAPGMYFVYVQAGQQMATKRMIKL
jgi:hypothetical protein